MPGVSDLLPDDEERPAPARAAAPSARVADQLPDEDEPAPASAQLALKPQTDPRLATAPDLAGASLTMRDRPPARASLPMMGTVDQPMEMVKRFGKALPAAALEATIGASGRQLAEVGSRLGHGDVGGAFGAASPLLLMTNPIAGGAMGLASYAHALAPMMRGEHLTPEQAADTAVDAAGGLAMAGHGAADLPSMAPPAGRLASAAGSAIGAGAGEFPNPLKMAKKAITSGVDVWKTAGTTADAARQPFLVAGEGDRTAPRPPLALRDQLPQEPVAAPTPAQAPGGLSPDEASAPLLRPLRVNNASFQRFPTGAEGAVLTPQEAAATPPAAPVPIPVPATQQAGPVAGLSASEQASPADLARALRPMRSSQQQGAVLTPQEAAPEDLSRVLQIKDLMRRTGQPDASPAAAAEPAAATWQARAEATGQHPPSLRNLKSGRAGMPISFRPGDIPGQPAVPAVRIAAADLPRLANGDIDWSALMSSPEMMTKGASK